MSFTVSKTQTYNQVDPESGLIVGTSTQTVNITVDILSINVASDNTSVVCYTTSYGDSTSNNQFYNFTYSGSNILEQATTVLKTLLTS